MIYSAKELCLRYNVTKSILNCRNEFDLRKLLVGEIIIIVKVLKCKMLCIFKIARNGDGHIACAKVLCRIVNITAECADSFKAAGLKCLCDALVKSTNTLGIEAKCNLILGSVTNNGLNSLVIKLYVTVLHSKSEIYLTGNVENILEFLLRNYNLVYILVLSKINVCSTSFLNVSVCINDFTKINNILISYYKVVDMSGIAHKSAINVELNIFCDKAWCFCTLCSLTTDNSTNELSSSKLFSTFLFCRSCYSRLNDLIINVSNRIVNAHTCDRLLFCRSFFYGSRSFFYRSRCFLYGSGCFLCYRSFCYGFLRGLTNYDSSNVRYTLRSIFKLAKYHTVFCRSFLYGSFFYGSRCFLCYRSFRCFYCRCFYNFSSFFYNFSSLFGYGSFFVACVMDYQSRLVFYHGSFRCRSFNCLDNDHIIEVFNNMTRLFNNFGSGFLYNSRCFLCRNNSNYRLDRFFCFFAYNLFLCLCKSEVCKSRSYRFALGGFLCGSLRKFNSCKLTNYGLCYFCALFISTCNLNRLNRTNNGCCLICLFICLCNFYVCKLTCNRSAFAKRFFICANYCGFNDLTLDGLCGFKNLRLCTSDIYCCKLTNCKLGSSICLFLCKSEIAFCNLCLYGFRLGNCKSLCLCKSEVCKLRTRRLILNLMCYGSIMNCNSIYTCKSCLCLVGFNCFGSGFSLNCINVSNFNLCDVAFCYLFYRFNNLCLCTCRNYNRMNYNRILRFFCGILRNCAGNYYLKVMVLNNLGHVGVVIFFGIVLFGKVFYIIINNRCGCGLCFCSRSLFFHNRFCFFFREFLEIYGHRLSICRSNCFRIVYRLFLVSNDRLCLCYGSFFHYRSCYGSSFFYSFCYGSLNRLCTCYRCNESINFVKLSACNNMCSRYILYNTLGKRTNNRFLYHFRCGLCHRFFKHCSRFLKHCCRFFYFFRSNY